MSSKVSKSEHASNMTLHVDDVGSPQGKTNHRKGGEGRAFFFALLTSRFLSNSCHGFDFGAMFVESVFVEVPSKQFSILK